MPDPPAAAADGGYKGVKLPQFIESSVKQWLALSEFSMGGLDARQRYAAIVRHLPSNVSIELADVVTNHMSNPNPDWDANYKAFQTALINHYTYSDRVAIKKLLATAQRGDRKPSAF